MEFVEHITCRISRMSNPYYVNFRGAELHSRNVNSVKLVASFKFPKFKNTISQQNEYR